MNIIQIKKNLKKRFPKKKRNKIKMKEIYQIKKMRKMIMKINKKKKKSKK